MTATIGAVDDELRELRARVLKLRADVATWTPGDHWADPGDLDLARDQAACLEAELVNTITHLERAPHPGDYPAGAWARTLANVDGADGQLRAWVPVSVWRLIATTTDAVLTEDGWLDWDIDGRTWSIVASGARLNPGPLSDTICVRTGASSSRVHATPEHLDDAQGGVYQHLRSTGLGRDRVLAAITDLGTYPRAGGRS